MAAPLINKLDIIFSKYIRLRDSDENGICRCCTCGAPHHFKDMDNGHYIKRQHMSLRFSEINCSAQCKKCNWLGQGEDVKYKEFIIRKYGQQAHDLLLLQKNSTNKLSKFEIEIMIKEYSRLVKNLMKEKVLV